MSPPVLRIEQRAREDGRLVQGGCYDVYASPTGGVEEFVDNVCDSSDDLGRDGIVVAFHDHRLGRRTDLGVDAMMTNRPALGFEITGSSFKCSLPPFNSARWV